ncbi:FkbM family methyltransferase [Paraburkholderia silvatlantica]|uniref:FkbM family methyltransferase n=1 Tax=Paraburkholderia silvatlantica TaxID=321895 RepID=UPI0037527F77
MPKSLIKLLGTKAHCIKLFRTIRAVPFSVRLPVFGTISTVDEVLNIHDNFGKGELRNEEIENHLRETSRPVIVNCGVNIGITVRWWHHLNPAARIIGFDMMQEAHSFTLERVGSTADWYVPVTCALSANEGDQITISFDDPLFGENSVSTKHRSQTRTVLTGTLDARLRRYELENIDLLKIDIEGHGAEALKGAAETLSKTRYVLFETHNREEITGAADILHRVGLQLIGVKSRNLIYGRK